MKEREEAEAAATAAALAALENPALPDSSTTNNKSASLQWHFDMTLYQWVLVPIQPIEQKTDATETDQKNSTSNLDSSNLIKNIESGKQRELISTCV